MSDQVNYLYILFVPNRSHVTCTQKIVDFYYCQRVQYFGVGIFESIDEDIFSIRSH